MKVLYDFQCFTNDRIGGISKYFAKLIQYLNKQEGIEVDVAGKLSNNLYSREFEGHLTHKQFFPGVQFPGQRKALKHFNRITAARALQNNRFDVFHPTYYNPYWLQKAGSKKVVLTVHDMIHELFNIPEHFDRMPIAEVKRRLIRRADKVIAISNSTKNDLLRFTDVSPEKIEVIYHGIDSHFVKIEKTLFYRHPEAYFLFVGRRSGYKNFSFMIRAIAPLLLKSKLGVVCVGGGPLSHEEKELISQLRIAPFIHNLPVVSELQLDYYYQHAIALIYPSLYEGFGMPILEANRNQCPVILANASSLPEVGGDAALYFDVDNTDSLEDAARKVSEKDELRNSLILKGMERIKSFSWEQTFEKTADVYRSVV
jgi:glycosyltransferase involved in cell wall biosynthesis